MVNNLQYQLITDDILPRTAGIAAARWLKLRGLRLYRANSRLAPSISRMILIWLNDDQEVESRLLTWLRVWEQEGRGGADDDMGLPFAAWIAQCAHDYYAKQGKSDDFDRGFSGIMQRLFQTSTTYTGVMAPFVENLAAKVSAVDYPSLHRLCMHTRMRPRDLN